MTNLQMLRAFQDKWPEIVGGLIGFTIKWFAIGVLFHLGWRVVG